MPIVLLLLGVVTTAAGLILVGSGLGFRDGTFQTDILTPGTIAAVGGLLLIAFGLAVREMRRIEQSFALRSAARTPRIDDAEAIAAFSGAAFSGAGPAPALTETKLEPPPPLPVAPQAPEPHADEAVIERLRAKIPTIPRVENGRLAESADVSHVLREAAGLDESVAEAKGVAAMARAANGAASPVRSMPRMDLNKPRLTAAPDKAKVSVFNTFWPAAPRRDKDAAQAQPAASASPQEARLAAEHAQPVAAPAATHAAGPVSVLKSGVVEGMAYTLYSDGSIEAQLPQGTLRFGSISALRNHIENTP
jgi:hypothetical protein